MDHSRSSRSTGSVSAASLGDLVAHIEEKGCQDVQVERHNVSQRQHQHHHIDHMTCEVAKLLCTSTTTSFLMKKSDTSFSLEKEASFTLCVCVPGDIFVISLGTRAR